MSAKYVIAIQLKNLCVRFVNGQTVTARQEHATRFKSEEEADKICAKWAKMKGIRDSWDIAEYK